MRPLTEIRSLWVGFKRYTSLEELKADVRIAENGDPAGVRLRSAYWKALLLFDDLDTASWQAILLSSRSAYEALRARFLSQVDGDDVLIAEIRQDVERCMPGIPFFQDLATQKILCNVLYVFCKLNPDLSYRQGMHELLAPIVWVIDHDTVEVGKNSKAMGDDALLNMLFSQEYVEHDAFALFGQVMQNAKKFYEQTTHSSAENPLVTRSQRIATTLLSQIDPELADHLDRIGIVSQIFLIRWLRLLFGREFEFADVLTVWDVIFAEDATLEIVDYISLTMLLRIRWELLDSTYNEALTTLLHYPPLDHDITAQSLAIDAMALRANMTLTTANRLVVKYTCRAMQAFNRPVTPPALQRNITSFSGMDAFRRSFRGKSAGEGTPQINFESLLQSTAQNIMNRGEQLGIGKAVRSAIDEVHRKAQDIREHSGAAASPGSWRQRPRSSHTLAAKLKALEQRNAHLSQMLDEAVSQLWDVQKLVADAQSSGDDDSTSEKLDLERFSIAIGQVQYVQVYLQDSSLPLQAENAADAPADDKNAVEISQEDFDSQPSQPSITETQDPSLDSQSVRQELEQSQRIADSSNTASVALMGRSVDGLMDPSAFDEVVDAEDTKHDVRGVPGDQDDVPLSPVTKLSTPPRPPLSETKFSWMLGQPKDDAFTTPSKSFKDQIAATSAEDLSVIPKTRKGIRPKKKFATPVVSTDVNLDFDS